MSGERRRSQTGATADLPCVTLLRNATLVFGGNCRTLPIQLDVAPRQMMRGGVFVARFLGLVRPIAERIKQLAVDEIAHVHGTDRVMVLHAIDRVEILASVGFGHAWEPGLVPGGGGVRESLVALLANLLGQVERLIDVAQGLRRLRPARGCLRRLKNLADVSELEQ